MTPITVPRTGQPVLSVVMVTYGGREWAARTLHALTQHTDVPYEVIVVDNDSPDDAARWLEARVRGATIIRNDRNAGFAAGCNRGAANARGRYLCFLNPDVLVEQGWLAPLLRRLDEDPSIGAVVPRFLNLDGAVQEAGSLVGREGATWALGHDRDPGDTEFRFPLDVDFGSAACMVVRRRPFVEVGGFDAAFWPAYGEDVDLCLMLRERGYRVVYEPGSSVRHARSVSVGVEGADRWIRKNRALLVNRWWPRLTARPWLQEPFYYPHRVAAVRDLGLDRVLIVSGGIPSPGERLFELLTELSAWSHVRVTVVAAAAGGEAEALAASGIEVVTGPREWPAWFEGRRYHYSGIVVAGDAGPFASLLAETQPHLTPRSLDAGTPADAADVMAGFGVAPPMATSGARP